MDTLLDSYVNCFRKYVTFSGRSARKEYIIFTIANYVLSLILGLIPLLGVVFFLVVIIPGISVGVRRLHDLNQSGWWIVSPYVLIILGFIAYASSDRGDTSTAYALVILGGLSLVAMSIWMLFFKGTLGPNRFGDEQKKQNEIVKSNTSVPNDNVTERLERAKKMLDDGLISESEYESMRKKILSDF